jgi:hypothetical protein
VHFHDIFWPFEYPYDWVMKDNRSWNELYALRAFLTNNSEWKVVFFTDYFANMERDLIDQSCPTYARHGGAALWLVKLPCTPEGAAAR